MKPKRDVPRRKFLQGLATAGSGLLAVGAGLATSPRAARKGPPTTPRVLALVGDRYHNADYIRVALGKLFSDLKLPADFTINYGEISDTLLEKYHLLVCLRDGMIWPGGYLEPNGYAYSRELENLGEWSKEEPRAWITAEQGRAIKNFVEAGHGLYALHNTSHISLSSRDFREVMGGAYLGHPPLRPFRVHVVNLEHPITKGVHDFMVNDEQHYVAYDGDPKHIILRSENIDGLVFENLGASAISGWAYDYGQGRVVFTAVGHTLHAMWQADYQKIQRNAVRWLLRLS